MGLSADELLSVVPGAHALIIRSATDVTDEVLGQVHQMAETLLSNPVIENYAVRVLTDDGATEVLT